MIRAGYKCSDVAEKYINPRYVSFFNNSGSKFIQYKIYHLAPLYKSVIQLKGPRHDLRSKFYFLFFFYV